LIGYAPEQAAALAGLLAGDGDPERALDFLADPEASLRLIMNGRDQRANGFEILAVAIRCVGRG
jgi:hypothetical protein